MSDYKEYRADFAKAAWLDQMNHGYRASDAALYAVEYADALIAELERTRAAERLHAIHANEWREELEMERKEAPQLNLKPGPIIPHSPEPPATELPRLNTGWKWAPGDGTHKITPFDVWRENDGRLSRATTIGMPCNLENCLATPDWHNPEGIESPGEGYRFLVKGEEKIPGDLVWCGEREFQIDQNIGFYTNWTYTTPATRPLPPVLADEKEVQP